MATKPSSGDRATKAAAIRLEHDRAERKRKLGLMAGVIATIAVIVAVMVWATQKNSGSVELPKVETSVGDHSLKMGPDSAPVKVVVYEDFLCPFCREFEESTRDFLLAGAQDGKVQVEFRPFRLLQDEYSLNALNAFAAVLASDTQKALAFHDYAFDEQPYEAAPNKPTISDLRGWANKIGVDKSVTAKFDTVDQAWVDAANKAAADAKITGTPTILVDGKKLEGATIAEMADNLEKLIAAAK